MNSYDLMSLDIVELDIPDNTSAELSKLSSILRSAKLFGVTKKVLNKLTGVTGNPVVEVVGDFIYLGAKYIIDKRNKSIEYVGEKGKVYGIVVPCNEYPFIFTHDGYKAEFKPYDAYSDVCTAVYRSQYASNEMFVLRAVNNFLYPDIYESLSNKKSTMDMATDMDGIPSLNYIYLVFALLGVDFPDRYGEDGASPDMLTKYGFREVV